MKRRVVAVALVGSLALLAAGCGGGDEAEAGNAADVATTLVEQGVDEAIAEQLGDRYEEALEGDRTINVYGLAAQPMEETFERFEKTFPGLEVVGTQLNTPDTTTKVLAEETSGNVTVGVVVGTATTFAALDKDGYTEAFEPLMVDDLAEIAKDPAGYYAPGVVPWAPVYGSDLDREDVPSTWEGLISGEYDGSIASVDPKTISLTSGTLAYLLESGNLTEEAARKLPGNDLTFYADSGAAINAVGSGEKDLMLAQSYSVYKSQKESGGLDVGFAFPMDDVNIVQPLLAGIPKGAPNLAASTLLADYLFTKPAQELIGGQGFVPSLNGVAPSDQSIPPVDKIVNPIPGPLVNDSGKTYGNWMPFIEELFSK